MKVINVFFATTVVLGLSLQSANAQFVSQLQNLESKTESPVERPKQIVAPKPRASGSVKIVAVVNGEIISSEDIQNRINAFLLSTKIPLNSQTKPMIVQKVLNATIDEKLKLQDANKIGIKMSKKEIDSAVDNFEKGNKMPKGALQQALAQANVSEEVFRTQMEADLAWIRVIRRRMSSDSEITQKEIETAINDAKQDLATPKFMVSEIFISKDKAKNLNELVSNLRQDSRFELYAMQFSESASASNGGNLGWVNKGKLDANLEKALSNMKEGEISNPILSGQGYYILKLVKEFDPKKDKPIEPDAKNIKKYMENEKTESFAQNHLQELRQKAIIELRN